VCESIRLFALCDAMGWAALPVHGGLYDQHPRLLEEWSYILGQRAEHQRREHEREQRANRAKKGRGR
jgi:hypothetical protein